jgi:hypothetical protein
MQDKGGTGFKRANPGTNNRRWGGFFAMSVGRIMQDKTLRPLSSSARGGRGLKKAKEGSGRERRSGFFSGEYGSIIIDD